MFFPTESFISNLAPSYSFFLLKIATSNSLFSKIYSEIFKFDPSLTAMPSFESLKFTFLIVPFELSPKLRPLSLIELPFKFIPSTVADDTSKQSLLIFLQKIPSKFTVPKSMSIPSAKLLEI